MIVVNFIKARHQKQHKPANNVRFMMKHFIHNNRGRLIAINMSTAFNYIQSNYNLHKKINQ